MYIIYIKKRRGKFENLIEASTYSFQSVRGKKIHATANLYKQTL